MSRRKSSSDLSRSGAVWYPAASRKSKARIRRQRAKGIARNRGKCHDPG